VGLSLPANEEPYIGSPILDAIHVARSLQGGAEEETGRFTSVMRLLGTVTDVDQLIEWPT
jgi:hypothetical protein